MNSSKRAGAVRESLDRLSPALVSDDLSITDRRGDADYVAALGYASMTYPIASPLIRMYLSHDRAAVREATAMAADMARRAARRAGLHLRASDLIEIGRMALEFVVHPTCQRCHGTKYELIPGTNCLGPHACKACGGDGRRKIPAKNKRVIVDVIARIQRIESTLDVIVANRV